MEAAARNTLDIDYYSVSDRYNARIVTKYANPLVSGTKITHPTTKLLTDGEVKKIIETAIDIICFNQEKPTNHADENWSDANKTELAENLTWLNNEQITFRMTFRGATFDSTTLIPVVLERCEQYLPKNDMMIIPLR